MIVEHERVAPSPRPEELPAADAAAQAEADRHLDHLLALEVEEPWYKTFIQNIKETLNPPKLPPLEVTSKPVEVKDIWGAYEGQETKSGILSLLIHGGVIALLVFLGTNKTIQNAIKQHVTLIAPNLAPYEPPPPPKHSNAMGGGGGGGDRSPLPASKGRLPKISNKQFVPPQAVILNEHPKLVMEPTIIAQPDANLPKIDLPQYGDPLAKSGIPSNGTGANGGIGSGTSGGVGSGKGAGYGPGEGGNVGGGVYRIGGVDRKPELLSKVEPEYSEEARKAKFQGTVLISLIVDQSGHPYDIRVVRPLGLGLDEKAIEAVRKWTFRPAMVAGKPVKVRATVEVNFRLL